MAKRGAKRTRVATDGKARLEVRVDEVVANRLFELAERAGLSVNQIMAGLARWAVDNGHPGTPVITGHRVESGEVPGCVWFGQAEWDVEESEDGQLHPSSPVIVLALDYSDARAIRNELHGKRAKSQKRR
ncbi:MAG TPA: hypothetical protein VGN72_21285 [Tepidisphaeraceae bacterium]|jgi:hypothetical protein|nr:hypothetical protein [Tepidisphaeraceae bacterium]